MEVFSGAVAAARPRQAPTFGAKAVVSTVSVVALGFASVVSGMFAFTVGLSRSGVSASHAQRISAASLHPPVTFEPNVGQAPAGVDFVARLSGATAQMTPTGLTLAVSGRAVGMTLQGGDPTATATGVGPPSGVVNSFLGNDPANWRSDVNAYNSIQYHNVYPGIDLVWYFYNGRLEYDFVVAPSADPGRIALVFTGVTDERTDKVSGDLLLATAAGTLRQHAPYAYQTTGGVRRAVHTSFIVRANGVVGFSLGSYAFGRRLVIDPSFVYSTLVGGSDNDQANAVAVDTEGNAYITGNTCSADFPTVNPLQGYKGPTDCLTSGSAAGDVFVTKINSRGSKLTYSTYLGGTGDETSRDIAVDSSGSAYVVGTTSSSDFPVTPGAFQTHPRSLATGFVAKLTPSGSQLDYSTYLGGSSNGDDVYGVAVDGTGDAYVAGVAASSDFPVTPGALQTVFGGGTDAFVSKLSRSGSSLEYSTFLGGTGYDCDFFCRVAVNTSGAAFLVMDTTTAGLPTTPGAYQPVFGGGAGDTEAYVAELSPSGTALAYATYLGHTGTLFPLDMALGPNGAIYVTGDAISHDLPTTPGAYQPARAPGAFDNAFVSVIMPAGGGGSDLRYSTYLGGDNSDQGTGIAVDSKGRVYVVGVTASSSFPVHQPLQRRCGCFENANAPDAFAAQLSPSGKGSADLRFSTFLGGTGSDFGSGVALASNGDMVIAGTTNSPGQSIPGVQPLSFPTTKHSFQPMYVGPLGSSPNFDFYMGNAFVVRIALSITGH